MELILHLIKIALIWGAVALLVWAGLLCARDSLAAERRNAARRDRQSGRETAQDQHSSWLALGD